MNKAQRGCQAAGGAASVLVSVTRLREEGAVTSYILAAVLWACIGTQIGAPWVGAGLFVTPA